MHGGGGSSKDGKKKARIEIIPLIDVVFFLLATFVLFTLSLNKIQSIPVDLPVAAPPSNLPPPEIVTLQVSDAGIYWNHDLITMDELAPRLANYVSTEKDPKVLIAGDDRGSFGDTVRVLDEVRKVNIKKVSVETRTRQTGK